MKKALLLFLPVIFCIFFACKKNAFIPEHQNAVYVMNLLKDSLPISEFRNLDVNSLNTYKGFIRINFLNQSKVTKFVLLQTDSAGTITTGKVITVTGLFEHVDINGRRVYDGSLKMTSLQGNLLIESVIKNNYLMALHSATKKVDNIGINSAPVCNDCTLPEFITASSQHYNAPLMGLYWVFQGVTGYYSNIGGNGGGNDGSSGNPGDAPSDPADQIPEFVQIDFDFLDRTKVDPSSYVQCFGAMSNNLATYTISISADLPVDDNPNLFFDWKDWSPGHAFVTLSKGNPTDGTVSQNLGFYPNVGWHSISMYDINSKVVDDGGHEFQAKYTVTITAQQFQAAIDKLAAIKDKKYNLALYNCTDFALDVFKAAVPGFTIPLHTIPNVVVPMNTPQGLYEQIQSLNNNGTVGAQASASKKYTVESHGPCN